MINQIQAIKSFVDRSLGDIPHALSIDKDAHGREYANGDLAICTLKIGERRFRIEVTSSYIKPPLGEITMTDLGTQHVIAGKKSDDLWKQIEGHIRGTPYTAATEAKAETAPQGATVTSLPLEPSDGRMPYLAQPVLFITERGCAIGGMTELAAIVTRVISPTVVSLTVLPDTGEVFWRSNMRRRSAAQQFNCWDFADDGSVASVAAPREAKAKRA